MDKKLEITTPKNKTRSLGLKRSMQRIATPKTPLSDVKINYKSLQDAQTSSPSTPCVAQKLPLKTSAYTTNCLPYRLSLSRRVREKYKKKKLEFAVPVPEPEEQSLHGSTNDKFNIEEHTPEDMLQEIQSKENIIKSHERHQEKVHELINLITTWKEAFKTSLEELSSKIEPKMTTEDLIARLGIPSEMIEYT